MIKNKRGATLTLNTIIVAILVIVVLVVLVGFFLFGFQGLSDQVKKVFFGVTTGTDRTLAMQNCEQYCDQAEQLKDANLIKTVSAYCNKFFYIDDDGDGEAEFVGQDKNKKYMKFYCWPSASGNDVESLNVPCPAEIKPDKNNVAIAIQDMCR